MRGQRAEHLVFQAALQRFAEGHVGQFVEPVRAELVGVHAPDFAVVGEHVLLRDAVAELPGDPVRERLRLRRAQHAARLGDGFEEVDLVGDGKLPEVALQRVVEFDAADADFGNAVVFLPFLARHEAENQFEHLLALEVEEMAAADVERLAVHFHAAAQPARLVFLFQHEEGFLAEQAQGVRKRQARWPGSEDDVFEVFHGRLIRGNRRV